MAAGHQSGACDGPPAQTYHIPNSQVPTVLHCWSYLSVILPVPHALSFLRYKDTVAYLGSSLSIPYPPSHFFLLGFSQAIGHGESSGEGSYTSFHLFLPICCQGVKKMAGSLSSCCHHILWKKKWFCHSMHTAGEKRCWDDQSILFSSADLREIRHKAPRGYRDYGTSHCQSPQSIPLPQLLPTIRTLFCFPVVNKSLQATGAHLLWLTEATLIKTTYN